MVRFMKARVARMLFLIVAVLCSAGATALPNLDSPTRPLLPPAGRAFQATTPFRFAVLSDTRGNMAIAREALHRIKREEPALVLHCGDIAQRYTSRQFDWVLRNLHEEGLAVPFCPVPGNHDIDREADDPLVRHELYRAAFGPPRYWFAYANALFVAFDNSTEECSAEDLEWLDETLSDLRHRYDACFVYMHVPPRDPTPGGSHALKEGEMEKLMPVLVRHSVSAVFCGHLHTYAEDNIEGIPIYVTGGAGEEKETGRPHHYLVCDVERDGSFSVARRDIAGLANHYYPAYVLHTKVPWLAMLIITGLACVCVLVLLGPLRVPHDE